MAKQINDRELRKFAKEHGLSPDEYKAHAIEHFLDRDREHFPGHEYVRHGGKHLMGKSTGYEVADGKYYPAPAWVDQFAHLFAERSALYTLATTLIGQLQGQLTDVERRITNAKIHLLEDLKLDPSLDWTYSGESKCLYVAAVAAQAEDTDD